MGTEALGGGRQNQRDIHHKFVKRDTKAEKPSGRWRVVRIFHPDSITDFTELSEDTEPEAITRVQQKDIRDAIKKTGSRNPFVLSEETMLPVSSIRRHMEDMSERIEEPVKKVETDLLERIKSFLLAHGNLLTLTDIRIGLGEKNAFRVAYQVNKYDGVFFRKNGRLRTKQGRSHTFPDLWEVILEEEKKETASDLGMD